MLKKTLPLTCALAVFLAITTARAQIINRSGDLLSEVQTITNNMPRAYSEGFIKPTSGELTKWGNVVKALLDGNFTQADALVRANFPSYQLFRYTDTGYLNRVYYLLRENYPVVKGWGTHIVNPAYARQIAIEVPHGKFDTNTELEGVDIFRKTGARFMIINGTARCANLAKTPCDGTWTSCGGGRYPESDMGHFVAAAFQTAHQTLAARRPFIYAFSLHGNDDSVCGDFFFSNGRSSGSKPLLFSLKSSLLAQGGVTVGVAGDGVSTCPHIGSTNVQGRFTNGSPNPCTQNATTTNGYFIHVEQSLRVRTQLSLYTKLLNAINANIPSVAPKFAADDEAAVDARVAAESESPQQFDLTAAPNPFFANGSQPGATIQFNLPEPGLATVKIYDITGKEVTTLANQPLPAGVHRLTFEASALSSGVYFCRLQVGARSQTIRLNLVK